MVAKRSYDYQKVLDQCIVLIEAGAKPEWAVLSRQTNIPESTLQNILEAMGVKHPRDLKGRAGGIPTYNSLEDGDKITHTEVGNYGEYVSVSVSGQIKSVEDLVEKCGVDMEKYIITDPQFRKWDVPIKLKADGEPDKVVVVPCIYISFKTVARHPESIMPMISPVQIQIEKPPKTKESKTALRRALIIPDVHVGFRRRLHTQELTPFHDRRVLDLIAQIIETGWFDDLFFIGDCMDFSEFSTKFTPEPEFYFTTQPALIEWAWWLGNYRQLAPDATIDQYEGNHDKRLETMTVSYMPAAYGLRPTDELHLPPPLSTERLLSLESLGVNYIKGYPDNSKWLNKNVLVKHGDVVRAGPGDSAKAVVSKTTYTTVFGHVHRREFVSRRLKSQSGDVFQNAICPGCACHIDGRVPGSTADQQWQQGLAVIEYTSTKENISMIAIDEGEAIYNGQVYKARNRDKEIDKMILQKLEKIK